MSKKQGRENDTVVVETAPEKCDVAKREESIQAFWHEHDIFNKSLERPAGAAPKGEFVFYDGPPFATGTPHYGHILAGTIKDTIPRFWTMQGYHVRRKWGWDCHGLPLENLIEKELGLATKRDIEEFGIQNFNERARQTVMRYADEWKRVVPRFGRFVDMEDDYKTMDSSYTESVWWVFKTLNDKGLVYEGFKGMHLCPRCGTTLSNFEVNQGYKDIKDIAVTVKLPLLDENGESTDTSLLVWTTTPWTLPGNLAAAVHKDYEYIEVAVEQEANTEKLILAKKRLSQLGDLPYTVVSEIKGADLVGRRYQPPFPYLQEQTMTGRENAWQIYHADYVELGEEGTGAVHLAPAYGEEDMELAKAHNIPIFHHVSEEGRFLPFVTDFASQLVKPKDDDEAGVLHLDADIAVVKHLQGTGALLKKENITHSYPHCWRCDTPLLNYATTSWFVEVTAIRDQLVSENSNVHWVPEHVGTNRFGKWLEGARDWAVSRQRYWGAPLPIWKNPKTEDYKVFGSLAELQNYVPKSGNTYFTMRHGESEKNVLGIATGEFDAPYPLTEKGEEEARTATDSLTDGVDVIITSPVLRAQETAKIIAQELGIEASAIVVDERIRETEHGAYEKQPAAEYTAAFPLSINKFHQGPENGETWTDIKQRTGEFIYSLEKDYQGKNILIISHGYPLAMMHAAMAGLSEEETLDAYDNLYPETGHIEQVAFTPHPHNDNYELDFHRPYIDNIELYDGDTKLERIPDVFDCWFESGSMPYGQHHYPFAKADTFTQEHYPANFIAEGLDQTRGWFYSLLVLGTALFEKAPFQNVIVNGMTLAEDGKKMSKSLQNYPDPMELADRVGVDAIRYYLLSSSIMKAEDLNFSEKEVLELQRKNIGRLHNVLAMYELYADGTAAKADSTNVLDQWICSRLHQLIEASTAGYKNYEIDKATRPIAEFVDDLSVWYVRRSRNRLKGDSLADKQAALGTLRYVLEELAKVIAPPMPFYAEYLWQALRSDDYAESVHLTAWPSGGEVQGEVLEAMTKTREMVTAALEARTKAGIKVRQPLAKVSISAMLPDDYLDIIADEVNVKTVEQAGSEVVLDTEITPELQAEGAVRELVRAVQGLRAEAALVPQDSITLQVDTDEAGTHLLETVTHQNYLKKITGTSTIEFTTVTDGKEVTTDTYRFTIRIVKA